MLSSLRFVLRLILSLTAHDAICKATTHPIHIKPVVKQLTDLRKMSLAMLFAILGLYIQANRIVAASWVIALILLTTNICSMYDHVDEETFQARVDVMGPAIFTLINTFPGFVITTLLCAEMIIKSDTPVASTLQALLAFSPGLLQVLGEALLLYRKSLVTTPTSAVSSEVPSLA